MNTTLRSLAAALVIATAGLALAAPAHADEHGRRGWDRHERHEWRPYYSGPHVYVTTPGPYYAPPAVYAPPPVVYAPPPPVVYAPAPAPSVNFVFPLHF